METGQSAPLVSVGGGRIRRGYGPTDYGADVKNATYVGRAASTQAPNTTAREQESERAAASLRSARIRWKT